MALMGCPWIALDCLFGALLCRIHGDRPSRQHSPSTLQEKHRVDSRLGNSRHRCFLLPQVDGSIHMVFGPPGKPIRDYRSNSHGLGGGNGIIAILGPFRS